MKYAYHGWQFVDGKRYNVVLKKYKDDQTQKDTVYDFMLCTYLRESEFCNISSVLANEFNKITKHKWTVKFLDSKVICVNNDRHNRSDCYLLEPYIDFKYFVKFTNNSGWYDEDHDLIDLMTAFSHWTYDVTNEYLMIVDLQGIVCKDTSEIILTDPAIHCQKHITRFGVTNLGKKGFKAFFKHHKCNDICRLLSLKEHL
jgi:hypothetical protein